ncbi:hypothetical protein EVAR_54640_1 [Eumeta japonica]|uniref:Uncharacterized protein n=1 Tax=Eumeta variegata TaxID=151549 RepID=A0A4C1XAA7_EUMVA|nr:hypothetical protein EVAR_54640_1 [Eumeta japonica]
MFIVSKNPSTVLIGGSTAPRAGCRIIATFTAAARAHPVFDRGFLRRPRPRARAASGAVKRVILEFTADFPLRSGSNVCHGALAGARGYACAPSRSVRFFNHPPIIECVPDEDLNRGEQTEQDIRHYE